MSEIDRNKATLKARKELSELVYEGLDATDPLINKKLLEIIWRSFIIRDRLASTGYVVTDDMVEERIKSIESRENVKREDLLRYLDGKGISFSEYFEVMRETIEYNIFLSRIITPLVTITNQEVKNYFYNNFGDKKSLNFVYTLIDFIIPKDFVTKPDYAKYVEELNKFHNTNIITEAYSSVVKVDIENVVEESLNADFRNTLKSTNEGDFSKPIEQAGQLHVFLVVKKDLKESAEFLKIEPMIRAKLTEQRVKDISKDWFSREYQNYYIKLFD
jgi:peptidyl-prolyl cis-trans isomerase SurA